MATVGIAIICKTPTPGKSKTRLSPPLTPQQCADLAACFIEDLGVTVDNVCKDSRVRSYASYTPAGSEAQLRSLLPRDFKLILQCDGDLGARLHDAVAQILADGRQGAIIISADSPTMPAALLLDAVDAVLEKDCVVLSPALDGGYTLIGLSRMHARLFQDIAWSTETVLAETLERAAELSLPVVDIGQWYDVDEAPSLALLHAELKGQSLPFPHRKAPAIAPCTSACLDALAESGVIEKGLREDNALLE